MSDSKTGQLRVSVCSWASGGRVRLWPRLPEGSQASSGGCALRSVSVLSVASSHAGVLPRDPEGELGFHRKPSCWAPGCRQDWDLVEQAEWVGVQRSLRGHCCWPRVHVLRIHGAQHGSNHTCPFYHPSVLRREVARARCSFLPSESLPPAWTASGQASPRNVQ